MYMKCYGAIFLGGTEGGEVLYYFITLTSFDSTIEHHFTSLYW